MNKKLCDAVCDRDLPLVKQLLAEGASPNTVDPSSGMSLLCIACECKKGDVARALLEAGAEPSASALQTAVAHECLGAVMALIKGGADVGGRDETGTTPLHNAVRPERHQGDGWRSVDPHIPRWLVFRGGADIEARNRRGRTPLHDAARGLDPEVLYDLIEWGADTGARDRDGRTPLHIAVVHGRAHNLRPLLREGRARDNSGDTPLALAKRLGHVKCEQELLRTGPV